MKITLLILAVLVIAAACWQHLRYLGERRDAAQDTQPMVYGGEAFHLILFLRTEADTDDAALAALRNVKMASEPDLQWIYAGRVAANGGHSTQLGQINWTATALLQASTRAKAEQALAGKLGQALAEYPQVHVQGFVRPVLINLVFPQVLGLRRLWALVRGEPSSFPFTPREADWTMPEAPTIAAQILRGESLNRQAAVVVNISSPGNAEQQANDEAYAGRMLNSMAEGGYGPIHIGQAVRVMGEAEFETVAIVYYPGVRFFGDMIQSDFFQSIIGGKQLGDNQSTITVPVLNLL
ncbi:MAG: hypothetical protein AAF993_08775 [Pseudomonadota bacterium]